MTYALAFGLVYVYGSGVAFPLCLIYLTTTRYWPPWARVCIAFASSLAWPVLAIGWLVADE